jgi:hypothetical protein
MCKRLVLSVLVVACFTRTVKLARSLALDKRRSG